MRETTKIFVGSANFDTNYGSIFKQNTLTKKSVKNILHKVAETPNLLLDTAKSYKNTLHLIGRYVPKKLNQKIMTKIFISENDNYYSIINLVKESLESVRQEIFFSVLVHNADIFRANNADESIAALEDCQKQGLTQNIGVSCYEACEITSISSNYDSLTDFQIPENVIDQRNFVSKDFDSLKASNKSIYVRSIFLQGSLLSDPSNLPKFLLPELQIFHSFEEICKTYNISKLKGCLDYVRSISWKSGLIVGVQSEAQLDEILIELANPTRIKIFTNPALVSSLVDPRTWG